MKVVVRTFIYIKQVPSEGIFFKQISLLTLKGFTSYDQVAYNDTRRFISRFSIYLGSSIIFWKKVKQHIILKSSLKIKYRTLVNPKVQCLIYLLKDFYIKHTFLNTIFGDNKSTIYITNNICSINILNTYKRIVLFRDKVQDNTISLFHIIFLIKLYTYSPNSTHGLFIYSSLKTQWIIYLFFFKNLV